MGVCRNYSANMAKARIKTIAMLFLFIDTYPFSRNSFYFSFSNVLASAMDMSEWSASSLIFSSVAR